MKKCYSLIWLCISFYLLSTSALFGQCFNADVESGDLSAYQIFTGSIRRAGNLDFDIGNSQTRIKVLNKLEGYDLIADQYCMNRLPVVSPDGGLYSLRLGNSDAGSQAEKVKLTFKVDASLPFFLLQYAVVLNDPQHRFHEQPRFELRILDSNGNPLDGCGEYNVRAGNNIPGFENCKNGWRVRPWTTVGFELTDYIGQEISIEILVTDCSLKGHAGYAYVDASCKPLGIDIEGYCPGNNSLDLKLTNGFQDYLWSTGETTPSITINNPIVGDAYSVTVTNVTGCQLVINDTIPLLDSFPPPSLDTLPDLRICQGEVIKIVPTGAQLNHITNLNSGISADSFLLAPLENTTYTIVAYDKYKCKADFTSFKVEIKDFLKADFDLEKAIFCENEPIIFNRTSSGNITESYWDFGDGTFSTDSIPITKTYENSSAFPRIITVTLTERNDCGVDKTSKRLTINPVSIIANFEMDKTEVCVGENICFYNLSTPDAEIIYDLGDDQLSNMPQTCYAYQDTGTYHVTIKALSECGIDSMTRVLIVKPLPEIEIQRLDSSLLCTSDTTALFFTSTLPITEQIWLPNRDTSFFSNQVNVFSLKAGRFFIDMEATAINGCKNTDIIPLDFLQSPVSAIILDSLICVNDTISINAVTEDSTNYDWLVEDTIIQNESSFAYSFDTIGAQLFKLKATNNLGCSTEYQQQAMVYPIPEPNFEIEILNDCTPALVRFNNLTLGVDNNYKWLLDGKTIADTYNAEYIIEEGGVFLIDLVVINKHGCSNQIRQEFRIKQTPNSNILAHESRGCGNMVMPFKASPCDGCNYEWRTSANLVAYEANPNFIFPSDSIDIMLITTKELCSDTVTTVIYNAEPLNIITSIEHNLCFGDSIGKIMTEVTGGTTPYSFTWDGNNRDKDLSNLAAGMYVLKIEDKNGCTLEKSVSIIQPTKPLSVTKIAEQVVSCYGGKDGSIDIQANGGTAPYDYQWENGTLNSTLTNIQAGKYAVITIDANNCVMEDTFEILQNSAIDLGNIITPITCFEAADGQINLENASGGIAPYWAKILESNAEGTFFKDLPEGIYTLITTDAIGCMDTSTLEINEPEEIWIDILEDNQQIKQGEVLQLNTDYNIEENGYIIWSPDNENSGLGCIDCDAPTIQPLQSINYIVALTDENNCTVSDSIFIDVEIDRGVFIPTGFSPHGHTKNHYFFPQANNPGIKQIKSFKVFDRYGGVIHEALNFPVSASEYGWDGTSNGILLSSDYYRYSIVLEYVDGHTIEKRKSIYLNR